MTNQEEIREEYHEHPHFNGQWHWAVWVMTWASTTTSNGEPPDDAPISCAICGRSYAAREEVLVIK